MAKGRSPNYPGLNFETAIDRITRIYRAEHKHAAAQIAIMKDLGYSSASGRALAQLGAIRAYGLLEGRGDALKVTDDAVAIVEFSAEPQNVTRLDALRKCAFAPSIFQEMETQFGYQPPSDPTMRHWLVAKDYLSKAADEVIQTYKENLEFLKRLNVSYTGRDGSTDPEKPPIVKVGDYVQWESLGVIQFAEPKRVREISADGEWAFVDGSATGMRIKELSIEPAPVVPPPVIPPAGPLPLAPPTQGSRQDVFSLAEGPVSIQWPASLSAASYEDLSDWLDILKRKIGRSVKGQKVASLEDFSKSAEE